MSPRQRRFDRLVGMLALVALVVGILMVLQPFVSSVLWAIVLTYSTWPVFEVVRRWVRGNSTLAAALTTALLAVVILLPITVLGLSLGDSVAPVAEAIRDWWARGLPDPPEWVADLPVVGSSLHGYWADLAHDSAKLGNEIKRLLEPLRHWLLSGGLQIGAGLLYLVLSVVLAFFFYRDGDAAGLAYARVLHRIAGARAARLSAVACGTIRSVVYGILGTAFAQAILAAIGLWIAGVPGALLWGMLTFFLSVVPVGPPLVWGRATVWLFSQALDRLGGIHGRVGLLRHQWNRQHHQAVPDQPRQPSALHPHPGRRAGRRAGLRLHRRVPRPAAAGLGLPAPAGVGIE